MVVIPTVTNTFVSGVTVYQTAPVLGDAKAVHHQIPSGTGDAPKVAPATVVLQAMA